MLYHYTDRLDPVLANNVPDPMDTSSVTGLFAEWKMNKGDADFSPNWWYGYHDNKALPATLYPGSAKPVYVVDPAGHGITVANYSNTYTQINLTDTPETDGLPEAMGTWPTTWYPNVGGAFGGEVYFLTVNGGTDGGLTPYGNVAAGNALNDGFTVEFWFYHSNAGFSTSNNTTYFSIGNVLDIGYNANSNSASASPLYVSFCGITGNLNVKNTITDASTVTYTMPSPFPSLVNTWNHIAVTYTPARSNLNFPRSNTAGLGQTFGQVFPMLDVHLNGKWWSMDQTVAISGGTGGYIEPDLGLSVPGVPLGTWAAQNICIGGNSTKTNSTFKYVHLAGVNIWSYSRYNPVPNVVTNSVSYTSTMFVNAPYTSHNFTPVFPGYQAEGNTVTTPMWPSANTTELSAAAITSYGNSAPAAGTAYYYWALDDVGNALSFAPTTVYSNVGTNASVGYGATTSIVGFYQNNTAAVQQSPNWLWHDTSPYLQGAVGLPYIGANNAGYGSSIQGNSSAYSNSIWNFGVIQSSLNAVVWVGNAGPVTANTSHYLSNSGYQTTHAPSFSNVYTITGYVAAANSTQFPTYYYPQVTVRPGDTAASFYISNGTEIANDHVFQASRSSLSAGFENFSTYFVEDTRLNIWDGSTITDQYYHNEGTIHDWTLEFWTNWANTGSAGQWFTFGTYPTNTITLFLANSSTSLVANAVGNTVMAAVTSGYTPSTTKMCSVANSAYGWQSGMWNHVALVNRPSTGNSQVFINGLGSSLGTWVDVSCITGATMSFCNQMTNVYMRELSLKSGATYTANFTPTPPTGLVNVATLY